MLAFNLVTMLAHRTGDGDKKPVTGESTKKPVKTIARGMPDCTGVTVVTNSCAFYSLHARLRTRSASGIPCALRS